MYACYLCAVVATLNVQSLNSNQYVNAWHARPTHGTYRINFWRTTQTKHGTCCARFICDVLRCLCPGIDHITTCRTSRAPASWSGKWHPFDNSSNSSNNCGPSPLAMTRKSHLCAQHHCTAWYLLPPPPSPSTPSGHHHLRQYSKILI